MYRFPDWKGEYWSSKAFQYARYFTIRPFLGTDSVGAEIGVYRGGFGEFLKQHTSTLYLVDVWDLRGVEDVWKRVPDGLHAAREAYELVKGVYQDDPGVEVCREASASFLARFPDEHFDFIYVDANHDHEAVTEDLRLSYEKIKPGMYIIGDDLPKVDKSSAKFAQERGLQRIDMEYGQWAIRKPVGMAWAHSLASQS